MARPDKQQWYFDIVKLLAQRSTCIRRQVGAIAVKDDRILSTGFNGAPSGIEHCTAETCIRTVNNIPSGQNAEICKAIHAEQNLLVQAAIYGISLKDASVYCTTEPCFICAKLLKGVGIKQVYFLYTYPDDLAYRTGVSSQPSKIFTLPNTEQQVYSIVLNH